MLLLHKKVPHSLFALSLIGLSVQAGAAITVGKAVSTSGDVLIRNEDSSVPKFRKLKTGEEIFQGDVLNTASGASAKLLLADRSILDLGGSTLFKVDEFNMKGGSDRKVTMTMGYGKIRASVNTPVGSGGKFNIRTKTATMGVRGTEFIISSDLAEIAPPPAAVSKAGNPVKNVTKQEVKTQITVIEGKVLVAENAAPEKAAVAVTKGEQLTTVSEVVDDKAVAKTGKDSKAKVVELSSDQMKQEVKEAKIEDKTFKKSVVIDSGKEGGPSSGLSTLTEVGTAFEASDLGVGAGIQRPFLFPNPPPLPPGTAPIRLQVVFKK